MYGLLLESIVEVAKKHFGNAVWDKVRQKIKLDIHLNIIAIGNLI